jgi:hypothetical protein
MIGVLILLTLMTSCQQTADVASKKIIAINGVVT